MLTQTVETQGTVFVVDDDSAMRDSLMEMMDLAGLSAESYASAEEFLDAYHPSRPGCLVADVRMPGMSGIELQEKLNAENVLLPIIIITGHGDIPMATRSIQMGAVAFLEKPFKDTQLLDHIRSAMEGNARERSQASQHADIADRFVLLSQRERQVMDLVVAGRLSKQIARQLHISQSTVEDHRKHIMEKMGAATIADLVRLVVEFHLRSESP